jgi:hypothetical protein
VAPASSTLTASTSPRLEPTWLGVVLFSAIFLAVGVLIAFGVERTIDRWPWSNRALVAPLAPLVVTFPIYAGGILATVGA